MKKLRHFTIVLLGALLAFAFVFMACSPDEPDPVEPADKVLRRIAVTAKPNKVEYEAGETFDKSGMVVTGYYSDNTNAALDGYTVDKTEALTKADTEVTVTCESKIATVGITVYSVLSEMLEIENGDNQVYAVEAETLDYSECKNSNDQTRIPNVEPSSPEKTSGGQSIGSLGLAGNEFGFKIKSAVDAKLTIVMRASAVAKDQKVDSIMKVLWNSNTVKTDYNLTWAEDYWGWENIYMNDLNLKSGQNSFRCVIMENAAPNIDCFYFVVAPTGDEQIGPIVIEPEFDEDPEYGTFAEITSADEEIYTVEAEALDYSNCKSSNHPGSPPNFENPDPSRNTSGGACVSSLGVKGNQFGLEVTSTVEADLAICLRLSTGASVNQDIDKLIEVRFNGKLIKTNATLKFDGNWHVWKNVYIIDQTLEIGRNVLDVRVVDNGSPNIDCFQFLVNPSEIPDPGDDEPTIHKTITSDNEAVYVIEAEDLDYSKCVSANDPNTPPNRENPPADRNTSGGLCISSLGVAGNEFEFNVRSEVTAKLSIVFRVASGNRDAQPMDELLKITWAGAEIKTGHVVSPVVDDIWHVWEDATAGGLTLSEGDSTLKIQVLTDASPNFDCFKLMVSPDDGSAIPTYEIMQEITGDESATYTVEAEALDMSKCNNSNFPGTPPNFENPAAERNTSGGICVSSLGVAGNRFGFSVTSTVEVSVTIVLRVTSGNGQAQPLDELLSIKWNGEKLTTGHTVAAVADNVWHVWEDVSVTGKTLNAGTNTLDISVLSDACPNLDCFRLIVNPA